MFKKRKQKKTLLEAHLLLKYYYGKNILIPYHVLIDDRLVIDNDCLELLYNPEEMFYITPLSKVNKKEKK